MVHQQESRERQPVGSGQHVIQDGLQASPGGSGSGAIPGFPLSPAATHTAKRWLKLNESYGANA